MYLVNAIYIEGVIPLSALLRHSVLQVGYQDRQGNYHALQTAEPILSEGGLDSNQGIIVPPATDHVNEVELSDAQSLCDEVTTEQLYGEIPIEPQAEDQAGESHSAVAPSSDSPPEATIADVSPAEVVDLSALKTEPQPEPANPEASPDNENPGEAIPGPSVRSEPAQPAVAHPPVEDFRRRPPGHRGSWSPFEYYLDDFLEDWKDCRRVPFSRVRAFALECWLQMPAAQQQPYCSLHYQQRGRLLRQFRQSENPQCSGRKKIKKKFYTFYCDCI